MLEKKVSLVGSDDSDEEEEVTKIDFKLDTFYH